MLMMFLAFAGCSGSDDSVDCPEGFTGSDCSTKVKPTKMFITKVVVKAYPLYNHETNDFWDSGSPNSSQTRPDVFLAFDFNGNEFYSNEFMENATGELTFVMNPALPMMEINDNNIGLALFDLDDFNDITDSEFMVIQYFQAYDSLGTDFPNVIRVDNGVNFIADVYFTYEW